MFDSGACMHMMSKNDLIHEEKEVLQKSKESYTNITANGSIATTEEASVSR